MSMPTDDDLARLQRSDPWQPTLAGDDADHTIQIPRVPPPRP
jgi:hypothetical protein